MWTPGNVDGKAKSVKQQGCSLTRVSQLVADKRRNKDLERVLDQAKGFF